MYKQLLSIAFVFFFSCSLILAQSNELLTSKDQRKIEKADRKIDKGNQIASKGDPYKQKAEELEKSGAGKSKINRQKKKAGKKIIKASSYYKEGYTMKYKAYKKAVQRNISNSTLNNNSDQISKAKDAFKKGSKWRKKSERTNKVIKATELLLMANNIQGDAIKHYQKILKNDVNTKIAEETRETTPADTVIVEETIIAQDSLTSTPAPAPLAIVADTLAQDSTLVSNTPMAADTLASDSLMLTSPMIIDSIANDSTNVVAMVETIEPEAIITNNEPQVYYTIQIAAERSALPKEKLAQIYSGEETIIEHKSDGWFKYSVGKYQSFDDAQNAVTENRISGFVVAYQGDERISTRVAKEILNQ